MNAIVKPPRVELRHQTPYLGWFIDGQTQPVRIRYKGQKHLLTFGTPGANKSMGLVVPNLATLRRSMIVIDPKGQLAAITARHRAKMGKVIVLNPFDVLLRLGDHMVSAGWNPLRHISRDEDADADARTIAEAIVDKNPGSKSEFFETSMENLWTAFCNWESRTKGKKASLRNVREMLARPMPDLLATLKAMKDSDDYALRVTGSRAYTRLTDEKSQSTSMQDVIETSMKATAFLNDGRIARDMIGDPIDFASMHHDVTTVYVILPVNQLRKQAKWLRMFINIAIAELLKAAPETATLPPILFMLDEFGNLGRLPEVLNVLFISRDLRIQLWPFLQNLEQLKAGYPNEWTYFFSGAGAMTTFNTGDPETAETFSKMFGNREVQMSSTTVNGPGGLQGNFPSRQSFGENTATQVYPLIAPEDLRRLGQGIMAGFIEPCPDPVLMHVPGYWEFPEMAAMLDPNPYYHG